MNNFPRGEIISRPSVNLLSRTSFISTTSKDFGLDYNLAKSTIKSSTPLFIRVTFLPLVICSFRSLTFTQAALRLRDLAYILRRQEPCGVFGTLAPHEGPLRKETESRRYVCRSTLIQRRNRIIVMTLLH